MINPRISADWSTTKPIALFSCKPSVQEVHTKAENEQLIPGLHGLWVIFNCTHRKCIAKHMINNRISADRSTSKPIAHSRLQEVHTKAEIVHHTPGILGLGVIFNCHA